MDRKWKSFIILALVVGIFPTSVTPAEKPCDQQNTKDAVCELQELVKQQRRESIGETDFILRVLDQLKVDIVEGVVEAMKAQQYKSCREIYADGQRENRAYELSLEDGPVPVYCHMGDILGCGSGGYTMVMKMDGNKKTFIYDSALWTNKDVYQTKGGSTGFDSQETKLPTYWQTLFTKVCLGMTVGGETKFISLDIAAGSLHALIADDHYRATSLGRDAWKSLISGSSLQPHCNKEGFNAITGRTEMSKARIGITSNNEDNCDSNDSRIGFGTGGPDDSASCGDVSRYGGDNGDKTIKAFGYILVQ